MGVFLGVAQGVDVLPLKMAIERQGTVFGEGTEVVLYDEGEWKGEFFAFPQMRSILLDIMRRVECGVLARAALVKVVGHCALARVVDSTQALVLLGMDSAQASCAGEDCPLVEGSVLWCSGVDATLLRGSGYALAIYFNPMP